MAKSVRLSRDDARLLKALAKRKGVSEAEVLREGITMVQRVQERMGHIDDLLRLTEEEPEPAKVRFRLK